MLEISRRTVFLAGMLTNLVVVRLSVIQYCFKIYLLLTMSAINVEVFSHGDCVARLECYTIFW